MLWVALTGLLFGFLGSVPVAGPVAILVVTRSLRGHARSGILVGVGSALSEAIYAFLAYLGFSVFLADQPLVVPVARAVATLILLVLGILLLRYRPPEELAEPRSRIAGSLALGFTISALNPTRIVTWTTALGIVASTGFIEPSATEARRSPWGSAWASQGGSPWPACSWIASGRDSRPA